MIKVEVLIYLLRSDTASKKITYKHQFTDATAQKLTARWVRVLIEKFFSEFMINESFALIYSTNTGYCAARSCTHKEVEEGFCFKYLEVSPIK